MNLITIVFAGINDHLHRRGFLSRLREPTTAKAAVWPAIKDILESMGEVVDTPKEGSFTKMTPRAVFALSPGYARLPDGLKLVYGIVALLSEGNYDVIISAPNCEIEIENLRKKFLQAVVEVSIVEILALLVTFGAENFVKGPVVLLIEGVQHLRLDGLLTLIAITNGNLGGLMNLTRYPEQMRENMRRFDVKKATDSWNKMRDLRHTPIQYLLHQNRFGTGENETINREEDVRRHVGACPC